MHFFCIEFSATSPNENKWLVLFFFFVLNLKKGVPVDKKEIRAKFEPMNETKHISPSEALPGMTTSTSEPFAGDVLKPVVEDPTTGILVNLMLSVLAVLKWFGKFIG